MAGVVPLYVDRWLAGTKELSLEESGAYINWIASYVAHDGVFPDSVTLLTAIWRCNIRKANRLRRQLITKGKLYVEDGCLHQTFAKHCVSKVIAKSTSRADAAFKRWKNHRENNGNCDANASPNQHANASQSGIPSTKTPREEPSYLGESQQPPSVAVQQNPSASSLATALPEGALARSPPPHKLTPSPELVATVANQLGYPEHLTDDERRLIAIEPKTWTPARILAQRNQSSGR